VLLLVVLEQCRGRRFGPAQLNQEGVEHAQMKGDGFGHAQLKGDGFGHAQKTHSNAARPSKQDFKYCACAPPLPLNCAANNHAKIQSQQILIC